MKKGEPFPITRMYPSVWVKPSGVKDDWPEDAKLLLLQYYFMHWLCTVRAHTHTRTHIRTRTHTHTEEKHTRV